MVLIDITQEIEMVLENKKYKVSVYGMQSISTIDVIKECKEFFENQPETVAVLTHGDPTLFNRGKYFRQAISESGAGEIILRCAGLSALVDEYRTELAPYYKWYMEE